MKSIFKQALLGLALSSCAAFASATAFTSTYVVTPIYDTHSTLKTFVFPSTGLQDDNTGAVIVGSAGDTFVFDYFFNLPDPTSSFDFSASANGVAFDYGFLSDPNYMLSFTPSSMTGMGYLETGTYILEIAGSYLADGGSFSAVGRSIEVTVPEPMSLSLIGLGLAGMAGLRRRKSA